jgi:hypothetical protein
MTVTRIKARSVVLEPSTPADAPNGSVFIDSSNLNTLSTKTTSGLVVPIQDVGAATTSLFIKQMEADDAIPVRTPVSKLPSGKIIAADADAILGQKFIGYSLAAAAAAGEIINVLTVGANVDGAIAGLGFTPGDDVYLSPVGGYTNNPADLSDLSNSVVKVGVADCPAGAASSVATDLIVFAEVIARP